MTGQVPQVTGQKHWAMALVVSSFVHKLTWYTLVLICAHEVRKPAYALYDSEAKRAVFSPAKSSSHAAACPRRVRRVRTMLLTIFSLYSSSGSDSELFLF